MKNILSILIALFFLNHAYSQSKEKITILSQDKIEITGDLYLTDNLDAPFIILFHQARFSRGEYIEIAPKLNKLGFNCLAIDQRSGLEVNKIKNETHIYAKEKGFNTKYPDAFPDLTGAYNYIKENYSSDKIIVWGSSYSASLVFVLAAKNNDISAVLAFSPGEYFQFENKQISEWVKEVNCPVFVTSSKNEGDKSKDIFINSKHINSIQYIPEFSGFHGSKALWKSKAGHEKYWKEVESFLIRVKK